MVGTILDHLRKKQDAELKKASRREERRAETDSVMEAG